MKFNQLTLATLAAAALQALAQKLEGPTTFTYNGTACPASGPSPSLSLISAWVNYTTPGNFFASGGNTHNCDIQVNSCITPGFRFRFAQTSTDVRIVNAPSTLQSIQNRYYFPGRNNSVTSTGTTAFLTSGNFTATNAYLPADNWSICGGCFPFGILTTLDDVGGGSISTQGNSINSALVWEAC